MSNKPHLRPKLPRGPVGKIRRQPLARYVEPPDMRPPQPGWQNVSAFLPRKIGKS